MIESAAQQLLDPIPIAVAFLGFVVLGSVMYEVGFRVGRWWQRRTPDEKEGPTSMLVGSLLALLAFLLAVTMAMASDRFDSRRTLVLDEANAIGTTYLRAGYLPEPYPDDVRKLLRAYAPLRVNVTDRAMQASNLERSRVLLDELWTRAEELARTNPDSEAMGLFIVSLNEVIDLNEARTVALVYARVPETVLLLLVVGVFLSVGMVGFNAGLTQRRSLIGALVLIVALSAVLALVLDLDRPREGFLQVSQQPLLDLMESIGPP